MEMCCLLGNKVSIYALTGLKPVARPDIFDLTVAKLAFLYEEVVEVGSNASSQADLVD